MSRRCFIPFSRSNYPPPIQPQINDNQSNGRGLADKVESQLSRLNMKSTVPNKPIPSSRTDNYDKKVKRKNITMNF